MRLIKFIRYLFITSITLGICSCENVQTQQLTSTEVDLTVTDKETASDNKISEDKVLTARSGDSLNLINLKADPALILAKKQIPILCYHQIRDWNNSDSKQAKDYIVPTERFYEQIKILADSGYQTILPDQLLAHLTTGAPLPAKPVMLTFDDTNLDQYTTALPILEKFGYKGVFFIMTVSLNRPRYMTREQVKELSDKGHSIGVHTWDHQNVKKYESKDWITQVEKPKKVLEDITGKSITYFAYPFGLWNQQAIPELKERGITAAFQLATKQDEHAPLYTIRRIIASGYWSSDRLYKNMLGSFK